MRHYIILTFLFLIALLGYSAPDLNWFSNYYQQILMAIGINIILTLSLNLVNGYMGEFSVGHAGFMAIGAYVSSVLTSYFFPPELFILATMAGGLVAAFTSIFIAMLSFKTRGDYLAILTLAFLMIVKSVLENLEIIGGPRGFPGIDKLTNIFWVLFWVVITLCVMRNLIYSRFGRNILAIREDEMAAKLMGVHTEKTKIIAFSISAFFTGVAGALYAHLLQFINPSMFDLAKSTDMLVMVYLGGAGSLIGSVLGATVYTVLLEAFRPLEEWRMIIMPLILILIMIFRPQGLVGWAKRFMRAHQSYLKT